MSSWGKVLAFKNPPGSDISHKRLLMKAERGLHGWTGGMGKGEKGEVFKGGTRCALIGAAYAGLQLDPLSLAHILAWHSNSGGP